MLYTVWRDYNMKSNLEQNSGKFGQLPITVISRALSVAATNTTTELVNIPASTWVTAVYLKADNTVANVDIDVGDGDDVDRYIDGVTTLGTNDVVKAPNVATGVDLSSGETGAHYYSSADTIDVVENTTASADTAAGTVRVAVPFWTP